MYIIQTLNLIEQKELKQSEVMIMTLKTNKFLNKMKIRPEEKKLLCG